MAINGAFAFSGFGEFALPEGAKSAPQCLLTDLDSMLFKSFRELPLLYSEAHAWRIAEEGMPGFYVDPILQKRRKQYIDFILKCMIGGSFIGAAVWRSRSVFCHQEEW